MAIGTATVLAAAISWWGRTRSEDVERDASEEALLFRTLQGRRFEIAELVQPVLEADEHIDAVGLVVDELAEVEHQIGAGDEFEPRLSIEGEDRWITDTAPLGQDNVVDAGDAERQAGEGQREAIGDLDLGGRCRS